MKSIYAALLAATSCAGIVQAQSPSPAAPVAVGEVLTLDDALTRAGPTPPAGEAAALGIEAAEAGRAVAALRPNPTLNADVENVIGTGPYKGINDAETTIGFALPLELGGKRSARIRVADAQAARARIDTAAAGADLRRIPSQVHIVIDQVGADGHLEPVDGLQCHRIARQAPCHTGNRQNEDR